MVAGAITVIAMVLGFAGDFLGLGMRWMRPAAELLLLAELVGLVVLERHQLFEPVHETVGGTHSLVQQMHAMMTDAARNSGQVSLCASTPEVFGAFTRVLREAITCERQSPQVLRMARLSGEVWMEKLDLFAEFEATIEAQRAYFVTPGTPPNAPARRWSLRYVFAVATVDSLNATHRLLQQ